MTSPIQALSEEQYHERLKAIKAHLLTLAKKTFSTPDKRNHKNIKIFRESLQKESIPEELIQDTLDTLNLG